MTNDQLNVVFEECIRRLQRGETLERVLADHRKWRKELQPALEAMLAVWQARGSDTVPVAEMMRSREHLRQELQRRNALAPRETFWQRLMRSFQTMRTASVLTAVTLALVGLGLSGLATVQALPGEAFYPVKLAAERLTISFTGSAAEKLARETEYDQRRNAEADALLAEAWSYPQAELFFSGFLSHSDGQVWQVGSKTVVANAELSNALEGKVGRCVTISARAAADGSLTLTNVQDRVYTVVGSVETVEDGRVKVSGLWAEVDTTAPKLQAGDIVMLSLVRLADGSLLATQIELRAYD